MERSFKCSMHCFHNTHGECHMEYCPRLHQAYGLLQKFLDMSNSCADPGEEEKFYDEVHDFLKEDKSWDPEERALISEQLRKACFLKQGECKPGDVLCPMFFRTGDDYGECIKFHVSCPVNGFADVSNVKEKNETETTSNQTV